MDDSPIKTPELLPCPICGGAASVYNEPVVPGFEDDDYGFEVCCHSGCVHTAARATERQAVELWNTRTDSASELREMLAEATQICVKDGMLERFNAAGKWRGVTDDPSDSAYSQYTSEYDTALEAFRALKECKPK